MHKTFVRDQCTYNDQNFRQDVDITSYFLLAAKNYYACMAHFCLVV